MTSWNFHLNGIVYDKQKCSLITVTHVCGLFYQPLSNKKWPQQLANETKKIKAKEQFLSFPEKGIDLTPFDKHMPQMKLCKLLPYNGLDFLKHYNQTLRQLLTYHI